MIKSIYASSLPPAWLNSQDFRHSNNLAYCVDIMVLQLTFSLCFLQFNTNSKCSSHLHAELKVSGSREAMWSSEVHSCSTYCFSFSFPCVRVYILFSLVKWERQSWLRPGRLNSHNSSSVWLFNWQRSWGQLEHMPTCLDGVSRRENLECEAIDRRVSLVQLSG